MAETTPGFLRKIAADPTLTEELHALIGTYCHQVRNHLNSLKLSLYFAKRSDDSTNQPAWVDLNDRYIEVERWLDRVQLICRPIELQVFPLSFGAFIEERRDRWTESVQRVGGTLRINPSEEVVEVPLDLGRFSQAIDDLAVWRFQTARRETRFEISWKRVEDHLHFHWNESPDSAAAKSAGSISEECSGLSLEGLTLPLVQRVVSLHGGTMSATFGEGWRLLIQLPIAAPRIVESRANDS